MHLVCSGTSASVCLSLHTYFSGFPTLFLPLPLGCITENPVALI